jgi:hypothetical protein
MVYLMYSDSSPWSHELYNFCDVRKSWDPSSSAAVRSALPSPRPYLPSLVGTYREIWGALAVFGLDRKEPFGRI